MPFYRRRSLQLPAQLAQHLPPGDPFDQVMRLQGEVFRDVPGRHTIRVTLGQHAYFVKQHFGVGWREIFKNLFSLRLPIISAVTEWRAIQRLQQIGIATTPAVAFGERGDSPASLQSFLITADLGNIVSLETLCATWPLQPPEPRFKRRLILAVAEVVRTLHGHGMNHRDLYICHLCLDLPRLAQDEVHLYLIDLHRVGMHKTLPSSARMKDLAALYFSAMDIGLTRRDYLRFLRAYHQPASAAGRAGMPKKVLREVLSDKQGLWQQASARAKQLYFKMHKRLPQALPLDT